MELIDGSETSANHNTLHPALEDGTDRWFRNVGKPQSDAGGIPERIHTRGTTHLKLTEMAIRSLL